MYLAIEDPYILEEEDKEQGIGIYEPDAFIESSIESSRLTNILFLMLAGWVLMFIIEIIIMVPLIFTIGIYGILTDPWALIVLTMAEIGFIIPPIWYVRKHKISIRSIGIKNLTSPLDIALGLVFGSLMLGVNLIISWLMTLVMPGFGEGDTAIFIAPTDNNFYIWLALWIFTMFVFVGFTEELMFRGFLQRRIEIIYRTKQSKNFKLIALVITSFIFAIIHLDLIGLPTRFILGLFLGYLAQKRNYSILGPTVAHGFNNSLVIILAVLIP
jgi:membrane protease YdiL (CAAX protease family)